MSAIAAVLVIRFNGRQARTQALINLLVLHKSDKDLIAATKQVYALGASANGTPLSALVGSDTEERRTILNVLNTHEFIAVGIRTRAFDEAIYKEMQCSNVLKLWHAAEGFIIEMRKIDGKATIFQDFERLACRWEKRPISRLRDRSWIKHTMVWIGFGV